MRRPAIYLLPVMLLLVLFYGAVLRADEGESVPTPTGNGPDGAAGVVAEMGTAFTYQGQLVDGGSPANGAYDFLLRLYDAASSGDQIGATQAVDNVRVTNGLFSVQFDFGAAAFQGGARWLEIQVRPGASSGSYTTLSPRQALTAAPYALSLRPGAVVSGSGASSMLTLLGGANTGLTASGNTGALGTSFSTGGRGVQGIAWATSGTTSGVSGVSESTAGRGVVGFARAASGTTYGVYGQSESTAGRALMGWATASSGTTYGAHGQSESTAGRGVFGYAANTSGVNYGVYGKSNSPSGYAGYFDGRVHVAGTLSKAAGSFKIDHPLDPANQYLFHSFVESPDMMNVYNGNITLDTQGEAWVDLPDWFEALNRDFRYQLTPIGGPGPNLYIAQEVQDNRFQIAGGKPGLEVSWQVTGIRQDAYANAHRIPVEEAKPEGEAGLYLHPAELGQPKELGLDYQRNARFDEKWEAVPPSLEGGE